MMNFEWMTLRIKKKLQYLTKARVQKIKIQNLSFNIENLPKLPFKNKPDTLN